MPGPRITVQSHDRTKIMNVSEVREHIGKIHADLTGKLDFTPIMEAFARLMQELFAIEDRLKAIEAGVFQEKPSFRQKLKSWLKEAICRVHRSSK